LADNVVVTAGTGTTVAADEVVDGTLGTVKVQFVKLMDGTLDGTSKAAVGARGLAVDIAAAAASIAKAEDAAHASGDTGVAVWAVRRDTAASGAADGDYVSFNTDDLGNLRVHIDDRQLDGNEYETVAASQTDQALGATGATGDYLRELLVVPATTSPGNVLIQDGAGSAITVFTGGASSVSNLVPFTISLGLTSTAGAWQITTGANVSVIGIGNFT
jgi:hypothetical protein